MISSVLLEALGDALDHVGDQRARHAPHGARALGLVARRRPRSPPSSMRRPSTSSASARTSSPFGPFTVTVWPSSVAVTPAGTRPASCRCATSSPSYSVRSASEHPAEHFAADILARAPRCPTSRPSASTGSRCRGRSDGRQVLRPTHRPGGPAWRRARSRGSPAAPSKYFSSISNSGLPPRCSTCE